jgi:hypothetical protein
MKPEPPPSPRVAHNKALFGVWMKRRNLDPRISILQDERLPEIVPKPSGIIDLSNVTLWSSFEYGNDRDYLSRIVRVLRYMNRFCKFKKTVLMSHLDPGPDFEYEWIKVIPVEKDRISAFLNQVAPGYLLDEEFTLSVHEDGFMLCPGMWDKAFLEYDYIGAPWLPLPGTVGNGGFCLESRKMNEAKFALPPDTSVPMIPADQYVCITHRKELEAQGLKFAPVSVAGRFSVDLLNRARASFGFHGKGMVPLRYAEGWNKIERSEIPRLNIEIVYVYWAKHADIDRLSKRFVDTYFTRLPGEDHKTTIVCNEGQPMSERRKMFDRLPNVTYLDHDDSGWDLGAYQLAARQSTANMIAFFGTSTYFKREGWLTRMMQSFVKYGNAQYGTMGHQGDLKLKVFPHIRTTAFWMAPSLLNSYPKVINQSGRGGQRYEFEHGPDCFTTWVTKQGLKSWVITWTKDLKFGDWASDPNGYRQGNQSSLLAFDHVCEEV